MGAMLPKAVESTVVEQRWTKGFRVGVCEMNGWRSNMEDAHVMVMQPDWGFFAVLDGHGGDMCSAFVAARLKEHFERFGCPRDDAAFRQLIFDVDAAFLATGKASGSTATMCIVQKSGGGKCQVRVANAGDSRILLGRRDGKIVDGGGTDEGLTTDHKPNHPAERQRIYRCGGTVEEAPGGVARVNGELAVSRGFGDAEFKKTGGPGPEDRPVTCNPEFGRFECDDSHFLLLVCDGISEGEFPNPSVVKHAAANLRMKDDPGAAANAVCWKALESHSKDNLSCMCVLLKGSENCREDTEFYPGPLSRPDHKGFMEAYEAMAKKAGLTLAQAAEMRHERLLEELGKPEASGPRAEALKEEKSKLGSPAGAKGSPERAAWWRSWQQKLPELQKKSEEDGDGADPDAILMRMLMSRFGGQDPNLLMGMIGGSPTEEDRDGRRVRVPDLGALQRAVDQHPALQWDERLKTLACQEGTVTKDDPSDGTSSVRFPPPIGVLAWLPTNVLLSADEPFRESRSPGSAGLLHRSINHARPGRPDAATRPLLPRLGQRPALGTVGRGGSPAGSTPTNKPPNGREVHVPASKLHVRKPR
mmetsp:Transcript_20654/g.48199  ORF Transcript_20654/g.48199 Transcript_20654/m.48199 type:complete len:588 (+) Transcript_20654:67-1830(+)